MSTHKYSSIETTNIYIAASKVQRLMKRDFIRKKNIRIRLADTLARVYRRHIAQKMANQTIFGKFICHLRNSRDVQLVKHLMISNPRYPTFRLTLMIDATFSIHTFSGSTVKTPKRIFIDFIVDTRRMNIIDIKSPLDCHDQVIAQYANSIVYNYQTDEYNATRDLDHIRVVEYGLDDKLILQLLSDLGGIKFCNLQTFKEAYRNLVDRIQNVPLHGAYAEIDDNGSYDLDDNITRMIVPNNRLVFETIMVDLLDASDYYFDINPFNRLLSNFDFGAIQTDNEDQGHHFWINSESVENESFDYLVSFNQLYKELEAFSLDQTNALFPRTTDLLIRYSGKELNNQQINYGLRQYILFLAQQTQKAQNLALGLEALPVFKVDIPNSFTAIAHPILAFAERRSRRQRRNIIPIVVC